MQISDLKNDIILDNNIKYFDYTASALALKSIENKMLEILKTYANTHSDSAKNSKITSKYYNEAKNNIKKSLNLNQDFALIACGSGSTMAIKKFQELVGIYIPPLIKEKYFKNIDKKTLPLVIISAIEHHSNELSFRQGLCETHRLSTRENNSDLYELERICKKNINRKIIISVSAASNITGVRANLEKISSIAKQYKALLCIDASSLIAYENISVDYDAMFISGHKLIGGVGTCGFLAIKKDLIGDEPTFAGGGTVGYVCRSNYEFLKDKEAIEEGGTPAILQVIKASYAFKIRDLIGLDKIKQKEEELKEYFLSNIKKIQYKYNITLYAANIKNRLPIFSLNVSGINPYDLARVLSDSFGIETRAGCACAGPYAHDLMNLVDNQNFRAKPGFLRISLHYTHDFNDIDELIIALTKSIEKLK
ncbi:aminotransferase class V-fold PLP-dependent enzyme [Campylobacter sp. MG1]|uniref:aminotransferase class V-fold PLP-dependent enzyme n=1 Tax=Campylobacter sp. MG1 TaxID=2976332 RepID=UPI00226CB633|nr:aminotransferase class V-fold PLP-dependent enzyme [Campylobacter sp. MG1]